MQKKAQPSCMICDSVEQMGWVISAVHGIAHGGGPPSAAEVRRERRRLERAILRGASTINGARSPIADIADAGQRRRWLNFVLENRPELRRPTGSPRVPVSGLVLYVLTAAVAQLLEHVATLPVNERAAVHMHGQPLVVKVVRHGREALTARWRTRRTLGREGIEIRVVAQLLDLHEKLVRIRLRPDELRAEVAAARARGRVAWVSPEQLLWAARYRQDQVMLEELERPRLVHGEMPASVIAGSSADRARAPRQRRGRESA